MAYFSLGQLLANIDETKKAFNQANYVLSESGLWIPVRASNAGEVFAQLKGSKLEQTVLTTTPLAAGATYSEPWTNNTNGAAIGLLIKADTPVRVQLQTAEDAVGTNFVSYNNYYDITVPTDVVGSGLFYIPPVRVGAYYNINVINPTATDQTVLRVIEIRQYGGIAHKQAITALLAQDLAIRDTATHSTAESQYVFLASLGLFGDGTHPIFVQNTLDEQITVVMKFLGVSKWGADLGSFTVPAGGKVLKTNSDFPGLNIPTHKIYLTFTAAAAPTTGVVNAYLILMGG